MVPSAVRPQRSGQERRSLLVVEAQPDLSRGSDDPIVGLHRIVDDLEGYLAVKANVTRFIVAVSLLATMALSLGAGLKW